MTRLNPIADGMCALKNAGDTGKSVCVIEPASKLLGAMLRIMQDAGYIGGFEFVEDGRGGQTQGPPHRPDQPLRCNHPAVLGTA